MRICVTCICGLYIICFPIIIPFAQIEWATSCLHSLMGSQYIYLQCGLCIHELETWEGKNFTGTRRFNFLFYEKPFGS